MTNSRSREGNNTDVVNGEEVRANQTDYPPPYDPSALGRVLTSDLQIVNIELMGAHFERSDEKEPLPASTLDVSDPPQLLVGPPEWSYDPTLGRLACIFTFLTTFSEVDPEPYEVIGRFRLTYSLTPGVELSDYELGQFVHWNAVFNAWPYWREYLASTVNRAGLPRFTAPVMGVPRQSDDG